jgi:hypothetical protein
VTIYYRCLTCSHHGETTGTEAGADVKHAKAERHATFATTSGEWAGRGAK